MEAKMSALLQLLTDATPEFVSLQKLGESLDVSTRTVFRYMRTLTEQGESGGYIAETRKGGGYRLAVYDRERFEALYLSDRPERFMREDLSDITVAILMGDGMRLDDLAGHFSYSRSSMSRLVSQISSLLTPFHITFNGRAHRGLQAQGSELSIRAALLVLLERHDNLACVARELGIAGFDEATVRKKIEELAAGRGADPGAREIRQFLLFCMLSAGRGSGHPVRFVPEALPAGYRDAVTSRYSALLPQLNLPWLAPPCKGRSCSISRWPGSRSLRLRADVGRHRTPPVSAGN